MTELAERVVRALRDEVAPALDIDGSGIEVRDVIGVRGVSGRQNAGKPTNAGAKELAVLG